MAGGSFASDPSFDAYNQQVNPAMASYFQTMGQLERSRGRLMEVSQGVVGAVPGAMQMAQSGLMRANMAMGPVGAGASAFHGRFLGAYQQYQGPVVGMNDQMGMGTAVAGMFGAQPFIQGRFQYEGSHIARDIALQNFNLAAQDAARTALTEVAPQAIMMGGFMMGGAPGALVAGGGAMASLLAPAALRKFGIDAALHRERFRRQIQLTVGERLGNRGGADRFRLSRASADEATAAVEGYVADIQQQYGWFAPEAREFEPLVQAAIATTSDRDLPKILESGAKGLKDRITALREAAAVLNTNFEEIAQLATEFGEDSEMGVGGRFDQFVQDLNRAATRGRGLNRRALAQAAIQARDQAISQGFQGEATQRGLITLAADIQQRANQGLIDRDYLFAFGGRTQAEAAINTALATQQMERSMAQGPFGMMALARMRGGGGIQGGLMGGAGQLGQQFARDPFGFMLSQYSPQNLTRMGQEAPQQLYSRMQQTFGMGQLGQLAFLNTLQQQTGMTNTQAMAQFRQIRGQRFMLSQAFGDTGLSEDQLMNAFLSARGMNPDLTIQQFAGGGYNRGQLEAMAGGQGMIALAGGAGAIDPMISEYMDDAAIARLAGGRAAIAREREATALANGVPFSTLQWDEADTPWDRTTMITSAGFAPVRAARNLFTGEATFGEAFGQATLGTAADLASGLTYTATRAFNWATGRDAERVTRERKRLMAQREERRQAAGEVTAYAGTRRFLEANMARLQNIGIVDEVTADASGGAGGQLIFGLHRRFGGEEGRQAILQRLAGQDPEKAKAMQGLLSQLELGDQFGEAVTLRLAGDATAGQVFQTMEQLSPESLAMALTAAGKEGRFEEAGFDRLRAAFESGGRVSADELKDENVRKQAEAFTQDLLQASGAKAGQFQNRYFSAFYSGSLAQTFTTFNADIQQQAFSKLANLKVDETGILSVRSAGKET